jgi:chemotaxis protein methyltransferase WspC
LLSVPCCTGEEPYSLALALDQEGVPASRCPIDGIDLARDHLLRAAESRYSSFSFREALDPRPKSFHATGDGRWELKPRYRDHVRFRSGNLVDSGFLQGEAPYDLILCRNLFIYLTPDGRARALANLDRLLAPDGRLCLTASEADRVAGGPFVADGPVSLAIFKRNTGEKPAAPRSGVLLRTPKTSSGTQPNPTSRSGVTRSYAHVPLPDSKPARDAIGEIRRLADTGNLDAARALCLKTIASEAPTASHFSLLGIIHLAAGKTDDAAEAFRKALYLEPDHAEALTHMIVLCEQRGEGNQAAGMRRRLGRLELGALS